MNKIITEHSGSLPRLENAGMDAWLVRLFEHIDQQNLYAITALVNACKQTFGEHLVDIVPSYTTVLVQFDAMQLEHSAARNMLERVLKRVPEEQLTTAAKESILSPAATAIIELPIWYHASVGPELARLSQHTGLDTPALIQLHSQPLYQIFALGFAPGFAFMGSLPETLILPRLTQPRAKVPAGSLAIAGHQTAIYPKDSPGGWNILGRCPTPLFDLQSTTLSLLQVGDSVRFMPISKTQFERLGGDSSAIEAER